MANQQGNKSTKTDPTSGSTGQSTSGTGTGAAADANRTGTSPGSGQDTRNASASTGTGSATGNTAGRMSNTNTTPSNTASTSTSGVGGLDTSHELPSGTDMKSKAEGIVDQVKDTASGTYEAVANTASSKLDERKGELSSGLRTLAETFRKTGNDLKGNAQATPLTDITAKYTGTAARQIENVANYFDRKDLSAVMRDAQDFARRNPAIFLGAAFGLGMLAARFLKSAPPSENEYSSGTNSLNAGTAGITTTGSQSSTSMPRNA
jgi:hypothetical protein